ncbi:hypothetical protein GCM10010992_05520 [Cloacibacterium rupense]|uniref:Outer membrane protein beta-barrel domain-containing protein n=1 Tax=Cloacibacterium rupense TaxID=517423 RepID=A0ABQ2NHJ5_9FLAO|nr:hypothetical protein [Cloacibacterium rupense]GGP02178.1 hypothetical protein GCM10010992_05520 [Cloacibacterium rupense]
MKKIISGLSFLAILFLSCNLSKAQLYDFAIGGQVDTGVGESLVGVSAKWQPTRFIGIEFGGNYGGGYTVVQLIPQFVYTVSEQTDGLAFYLGAGPSYITGGHPEKLKTFNIVGTAGAEFELVDFPISFFADWRPRLYQKEPGFYNTMQIKKGFEPGRFSFGLRYTF